MRVSIHSDARGQHMARAVAKTAETVARPRPHATRFRENHVLPSTSPLRVSFIRAWITWLNRGKRRGGKWPMQAISSHMAASAMTNSICLVVRVRNGIRKRFEMLVFFINRSPLLHISVFSLRLPSPVCDICPACRMYHDSWVCLLHVMSTDTVLLGAPVSSWSGAGCRLTGRGYCQSKYVRHHGPLRNHRSLCLCLTTPITGNPANKHGYDVTVHGCAVICRDLRRSTVVRSGLPWFSQCAAIHHGLPRSARSAVIRREPPHY